MKLYIIRTITGWGEIKVRIVEARAKGEAIAKVKAQIAPNEILFSWEELHT